MLSIVSLFLTSRFLASSSPKKGFFGWKLNRKTLKTVHSSRSLFISAVFCFLPFFVYLGDCFRGTICDFRESREFCFSEGGEVRFFKFLGILKF